MGENVRHQFGDEFLLNDGYGAEVAIVGGAAVGTAAAIFFAPAELTIGGGIALGAAFGLVDYGATQ